MPSVIAFNKTREAGGWMSNMAPYGVEYCGRRVKTTEHLFQALRFSATLEGEDVDNILGIAGPLQAKWAAKAALKLGHGIISPWSPADIENMRLCVRLKCEQNQEIQVHVAATGDAFLIEDTTTRVRPDRFWGAVRVSDIGAENAVFEPGDGSVWAGDNWLGAIWMDQRAGGRLL